MPKPPRTWLILIHDTLGSTSRTIRALALLAGISLLTSITSRSPDLLHGVIQLLHK
jgi:hypothetical protein